MASFTGSSADPVDTTRVVEQVEDGGRDFYPPTHVRSFWPQNDVATSPTKDELPLRIGRQFWTKIGTFMPGLSEFYSAQTASNARLSPFTIPNTRKINTTGYLKPTASNQPVPAVFVPSQL